MSKAFVKEPDNEADLPYEPPAIPAGIKNYMTAQGHRHMQDELHQLLRVERPKVVETVAWAAGNGDRSENGDYIYGKLRLREIDRRIRFLSTRLESAEVVDPKQQKKLDQVFFGATVTYADGRGNIKTIAIVGIDEADLSRGQVSWVSPVARPAKRRTKPASLWPARTRTATAMCWPTSRAVTRRPSGPAWRSPPTGRTGQTASWPRSTTAATWSGRRVAWSTQTRRLPRSAPRAASSFGPNRWRRATRRAASITSAPSRNSKTRWQILLRISTGPRRGIRRTALMPWSGRSANCWSSRCRAKVYMSFTAGRPKPPRSAASHNLLNPCPSPARWSGSRRRRTRAEPSGGIVYEPANTPQCPECSGNPRLLCRGTSSSNPSPSSEESANHQSLSGGAYHYSKPAANRAGSGP